MKSVTTSGICLFGLAIIHLLLLTSHVAIAEAEVQGIFVPTGSMSTSRFHHTATLPNNGKVLVAGGMNSSEIRISEIRRIHHKH